MAEKSGVEPIFETIIPRSCGVQLLRTRSSSFATSCSVILDSRADGSLTFITNCPGSVRGKKGEIQKGEETG